jgi:CYTH domain-containing protein
MGTGRRIERERIVSEREYEALLLDANPHLHSIKKHRHVFFIDGICYELDVFDHPHFGLVYLEVELTAVLSEGAEIKVLSADMLPEVFHGLALKRVTDDSAYGNRALAQGDVSTGRKTS